MQKLTFWLLDINYEKRDGKPELWMWGIDGEGRRVLVIERSFVMYFYLVLKSQEDPKTVLGRIHQQASEMPFLGQIELTVKRFFGREVQAIKVSCLDPDFVPQCAKALSGIEGVEKCLEDDFRYSMRYLIDSGVTPCSWHRADVEEADRDVKAQVDDVYIAKTVPARMEEKGAPPPFRTISFFPVYHASRGAPKPETDPVVIISTITNTGETRRFKASNLDDRSLMESFVEYVRGFDPDVIVGFETNRRHLQFLTARARKLGLKLSIDRVNAEPHQSVYGHVSITGRAGMDMLDMADELQEVKVKTIENVAAFLGVKRLDEQVMIDETDFASYWDDLEKRTQLLRYAAEKTECLLGIFESMFPYASQLSRLVGLPLDQIGRVAVGFRIEWYLIREAFRIGEIVPERVERPYIPYAGGMVLAPKPGVHENIAVLDFKSMYPNIMIEKNVSPDTYIPPSVSKLPTEVNIAPVVGHKFLKEPAGFYKRVLSDLIAFRDQIRARMKELDQQSSEYRLLDARQQAVKVITNAAYGYAGWIGARWFEKPVAEATAAWGREMIINAIQAAEELGLNVVYGDTDSIFVEREPERIETLSSMIKRELGLEIRPDKVYERILFTEAKKRYCGLLPNGNLEIVGLEVVRGDWANVARTTQERILELILKEQSPGKALEFVQQFIVQLRQRKVPYRDLIIWKTLTKPVAEYEVNAPHVAAARKLENEGWALTVGDKVGYIITQGSGKLYERAKPYMLTSYEEVDAEYYVANQVVPAALRILSMFGVREADVTASAPSKKPGTLAEFF